MTAMTMDARLEQFAAECGREDAVTFQAEFGEPIDRATCGDWDANAVTEAWRQAAQKFDFDHLDGDIWSEFREAYLTALHGSK